MILAILGDRKTITRRRKGKKPNPYGKAGDLLYGREAHRFIQHVGSGRLYIEYRADHRIRALEGWTIERVYRQGLPKNVRAIGPFTIYPWRPPMFMFRELSRIWLEVVSVSEEPLQKITEHDATREGFGEDVVPARVQFAALWDEINPDCLWTTNPTIRRIEFRLQSAPPVPNVAGPTIVARKVRARRAPRPITETTPLPERIAAPSTARV